MPAVPVVAVLGTFDTKSEALGFLAEAIEHFGGSALTVDVGTRETVAEADVDSDQIARAAGSSLAEVRQLDSRQQALAIMERGARAELARLVEAGRVQAVVAAGGAGNAELAGRVMQSLPLGMPKVLVTTLASGSTRALVGSSDIILLNPVVDVAGLNTMLRRALLSAAAATMGIARAPLMGSATDRPQAIVSMFGVTTPCVNEVTRLLEQAGREVTAFHATGAGGVAMERAIRSVVPQLVVDITTTEWADEVVGGVCSAGPDRLTAAGELRIPQVVVPGALDVVNFGEPSTVPGEFDGRVFHQHAASVTLMRTNAAESVAVAAHVARRLNAARGPVTVVLPLGGLSALDAPGKPFWAPEIDAVLFETLESALGPQIRLVKSDHHINDPDFAWIIMQEVARILSGQANERNNSNVEL